MSPLNKKTIKNKMSLLSEVIEKLEKVKSCSREDFMIDFFINDTAIRNLVLGIEIITDIGNHILSELFQSSAKSYKDIIIKLGETKVVPLDFAKQNEEMADFRNLIIHAYCDVNLKKVYRNLQKAPDIFRKFAKYYIEFLEKANKK